jgi:hypothetical protein
LTWHVGDQYEKNGKNLDGPLVLGRETRVHIKVSFDT